MEDQLHAQQSGGSPLPGEVRAFMEPRFGADFSGVRIHTDSRAASLSRQLSAQASTHGQDIYVSAGHYQPGVSAGRHLLAHELTHTLQQTGGRPLRQADRPAVTRLNSELVIGSFELDWGSGEISHKPSLAVAAADLTPALLQPLIYLNVMAMDQDLPGLLVVV